MGSSYLRHRQLPFHKLVFILQYLELPKLDVVYIFIRPPNIDEVISNVSVQHFTKNINHVLLLWIWLKL